MNNYDKFSIISIILITIGIITGVFFFLQQYILAQSVPPLPGYITTKQDLQNLFPQNVETIQEWTKKIKHESTQAINNILNTSPNQRNYESIVQPFDELSGYYFYTVCGSLEALILLHPDEQIRTAAENAINELQAFSIDLFANNEQLYKLYSAYVNGPMKQEQLKPEQEYYINDLMESFKRMGLHLSEEKRQKITTLMKEINVLSIEFQKNIDHDNRFITAHQKELTGIPQDFLDSLPKNDSGLYILKPIPTIYIKIMQLCSVPKTRKRFYEAFAQRAYPQNVEVLKQIVQKRTTLAQLLGYDSYAAYNLDDLMAKNTATVNPFLQEVKKKATIVAQKNFDLLKKHLPENIQLQDSKLDPWDFAYATDQIQKKLYNIDSELVAEYFPAESTLEGLLKIYEEFFGLKLEITSINGLWHPDVKLVHVYKNKDEKKEFLGYLLLDLHPRPNKYSHACNLTVAQGYINAQGVHIPAVTIVIANFPEKTLTKPSLLSLSYVRTFFHEFGHAIHALIGGKTTIPTLSGTATKRDFVELPSQMLEEWLWDKNILKMVSKHYKTSEPLPEELIDTLIKNKNSMKGIGILQQVFYAMYSLSLFGSHSNNDLQQLNKRLKEELLPFFNFHDDHFYTAFGHLTGYGAAYYSYLWSSVYALDLFNFIKTYGLLNPEIGSKYQQAVLEKGGTQNPEKMLEDFLGRKPTTEAFFDNLKL